MLPSIDSSRVPEKLAPAHQKEANRNEEAHSVATGWVVLLSEIRRTLLLLSCLYSGGLAPASPQLFAAKLRRRCSCYGASAIGQLRPGLTIQPGVSKLHLFRAPAHSPTRLRLLQDVSLRELRSASRISRRTRTRRCRCSSVPAGVPEFVPHHPGHSAPDRGW